MVQSTSQFDPPQSSIKKILNIFNFNQKEKLYIKTVFQCPPKCSKCKSNHSCDICNADYQYDWISSKCIPVEATNQTKKQVKVNGNYNCAMPDSYRVNV